MTKSIGHRGISKKTRKQHKKRFLKRKKSYGGVMAFAYVDTSKLTTKQLRKSRKRMIGLH